MCYKLLSGCINTVTLLLNRLKSRHIKSKLFALTLALLLSVSCSNNIIVEDSATVEILIATERTLSPINSYAVSLANTETDEKYENIFKTESEIIINDVKEGSYCLSVEAQDEKGNIISASVDEVINVQAERENKYTCFIKSNDFIEFDISWEENLFKGFDELGFLIINEKEKKPLNENAKIKWTDDVKEGELKYVERYIETEEKTYASLQIYAKDGSNDVLIATISPFSFNANDSIEVKEDYIRPNLNNIKSASINLDASDPKTIMNVTWLDASLLPSAYPVSIEISLIDEETNEIIDTRTVKQDSKEDKDSITFENLDNSKTYSISFKTENKDGSTSDDVLIKGVTTEKDVSEIAFAESFSTSYTTKDEIELEYVVTNVNAKEEDFIITSDNAVIKDHFITFPRFGDYTITIKSKDNPEVTKSTDISVSLAPVESFSYENNDDGSILLSWNEVKSASSYKITKTTIKGENADEEIIVSNATEYVDSNLFLNSAYRYTIIAQANGDSKFNSAKSKAIEVETESPDLRISMNSETNNRLPYLIKGYDIPTFTLAVEKTDGAYYKWILNGKVVKEGIWSENIERLKIDGNEKELKLSKSEEENIIELKVSKDGKEYIKEFSFFVLDRKPLHPTLSFSDGNNIVSSEKSEKLIVTFSDPSYRPEILFTSSDEDILTVDENGQVTAKKDGEATITATVISSGEKESIKVKSYIKAENIAWSLINPIESNILIFNEEMDLNDNIVLKTKSAEKPSSPVLWHSSDESVISVNDGIIKTHKQGKATIKASIDGIEINYDFIVLEDADKKEKGQFLGDNFLSQEELSLIGSNVILF